MNPEQHHLSIVDLLQLALRGFKTKITRTLLTILGMLVGIGAVVFLISLGYGLQFILIGKLVTTEDSLRTLEVAYPSESGLSISNDVIDKIKQVDGVAEVSPVAEFPAEMKTGDSTGLIVAKLIEPNYFRLAGILPDIGSELHSKAPEVVVSNQAAKLSGISSTIVPRNQSASFRIVYQQDTSAVADESSSTQPLSITGIITDDSQPPFALVPLDFISKQPPAFKNVLVKAKDLDTVLAVKEKLTTMGFFTSARVDLVNQAKKVMNIITIILGVFGITALVVSAIGMFNTMIVGFMERIYEVGIMKSIGASDRDIRNLFLAESFIMGFSGGVGGVTIGILAGQFANGALNLLASHYGGKSITLFITPWWFVVTSVVLSSVIGLLAGYWPAHRAASLSPKEAFKEH